LTPKLARLAGFAWLVASGAVAVTGIGLLLTAGDVLSSTAAMLVIAGVIGGALGSTFLGLRSSSVGVAVLSTFLSSLWAVLVAFTAAGTPVGWSSFAVWLGVSVVALSLAWLMAATVRLR
jgi:hypothetical protein